MRKAQIGYLNRLGFTYVNGNEFEFLIAVFLGSWYPIFGSLAAPLFRLNNANTSIRVELNSFPTKGMAEIFLLN